MNTSTFADLMAEYFGLPYEPPYLARGRRLAIQRRPARYQEVYARTRSAVAKKRAQRLFAEELARPSLLERIKDAPPWQGAQLWVPLGLVDGASSPTPTPKKGGSER